METGFSQETPWKFFKEIIVLNLPHRVDRRFHVQQELARFPGLEYSIFDGVYGKGSKYILGYALQRRIVSLVPDDSGAIMNLGQVACIVSHYLIWEQCLLRVPIDSDGYWILILEDDVKFHSDFNNQKLFEYLQHLPSEAKYFKFAYQDSELYSRVLPVNSHWNKLELQTFSTIAYAVHTSYLMSFLMNTYSHPLDWYPIQYAYGMQDLKDNNNDTFFKYNYYYTRDGIIYKHEGVYRGVARSFQDDLDSDINVLTQEIHSSGITKR